MTPTRVRYMQLPRLRSLCFAAAAFAFVPGAAQSPVARASRGLISIASERDLADYLTSITVPNPARFCKATVTRESSDAADSGARDPSLMRVRGRVKTEDGSPLNGANVFIDRFNVGTTTRYDGRFQFALPPARFRPGDTVTIVSRSIGYHFIAASGITLQGGETRLDFVMCAQHVVFDDTPWSNERDAGVEPVRNTGYEDIEDGSIVKVLGDVIVILHRGRLFTVRLGDRSMQRRSVVNAYNPSYTELGTWYQIYLAGRRVVTVGQTIGGDMPIGVFDVDTTGRLALRGSYVWGRSDTAAARMRVAAVADGKLVLYAEQPVRWRLADPLAVMPVLWHSRDPAGGAPGEIVPMSRRFYRTMGPRPAGGGSSLHSVAMCDLAAVPLRCESVHIVGPRTDQVDLAKTAAYAWLADRPRWGDPPANTDTSSERALLLRVPLDGSPPATLTVTGSPRSAFFEERGEYVNAMIRRRVGTALLRIPVRQFTSGSGKAASSLYRPIPAPASDGMFAAFVAQHLIYGTIRSGPDGKDVHTSLFIVSWLGGPITRLELPFEYYALHQMGENAAGGIVAGPRYFLTSVLLGRKPHISPPFAIDTSAGGLLPSGGFFYRSDGPSSGIAGLPVSPQAYPGIVDRLSPASVTFVTYDAGHFAAAGELVSTPPNTTEDGCRVSCWDWYGDARPIFAQGRIFALLGYELIEGQLRDGQIVETSRIDLAEGLVTP